MTRQLEPVLLPEDEVHLRVVALDAWTPPGEQSCALLSTEERATAAGYLFPRDRARYIAARVFLRTVLAAHLGIGPDAVRLVRGPTGKPMLGGCSAAADVRFNLSHSKGCAVCAVARRREVGADVERVRPFRDRARIVERLLSPGELDAYRALAPEVRDAALLRVWTCKEAYLKATGEGLTRPLREVEVVLDPRRPAALLAVGGSREVAGHWTMSEVTPAPGFTCVVVAEEPACRLVRLPR